MTNTHFAGAEPPVLNLKNDKNQGVEGICPNCKCEIKCNMTDYGGRYKDKLQWQNSDGSAHVHFDPKTKKFSCVLPKLENNQGTLDQQAAPPPQQQQQQTAPQQQQTAPPPQQAPPPPAPRLDIKELGGEQTQKILEKIDRLMQIEALIHARLAINYKTGQPQNVEPQKIGMYLKILEGVDV